MLTKRSFSLAGHRTSVALEPAFWTVLEAEARQKGATLARLVAGIDAQRPPQQTLASSLRLAALASARHHDDAR